MDDLLLGLELTVVGMGTVFLLLAALMAMLMGLGRIDRPASRTPLTGHRHGLSRKGRRRPGATAAPSPEPEVGPVSGAPTTDTGELADAAADPQGEDAAPAPRSVRVHAHGLDDDQLAAITIAVTLHAELRRRQAAPETRAVPPGQLRTSRWLALGRTTPSTTRS